MAIKVAVIGCGYWGPNLVRNLHQVDSCELVAVADPDPEALSIAKQYAQKTYTSHKDLLADAKPDAVIAPDVVDLIIKGSGGVMRDLVRLVQTAALEAEIADKEQIEEPEAQRALNELRRQLMAQLTPDYHHVLDQVRETNQRVGGEESEKCDLLLRNDIVLSYVNHDIWFAAHAALTDAPW